jgi:hypothetical protein
VTKLSVSLCVFRAPLHQANAPPSHIQGGLNAHRISLTSSDAHHQISSEYYPFLVHLDMYAASRVASRRLPSRQVMLNLTVLVTQGCLNSIMGPNALYRRARTGGLLRFQIFCIPRNRSYAGHEITHVNILTG